MPRKRLPDPLKPGHIPGQNPNTPERMPGHTKVYDRPEEEEQREGAASKEEQDDELDEALRQTFPASDPVSMESTLVPGRRSQRRKRRGNDSGKD